MDVYISYVELKLFSTVKHHSFWLYEELQCAVLTIHKSTNVHYTQKFLGLFKTLFLGNVYILRYLTRVLNIWTLNSMDKLAFQDSAVQYHSYSTNTCTKSVRFNIIGCFSHGPNLGFSIYWSTVSKFQFIDEIKSWILLKRENLHWYTIEV